MGEKICNVYIKVNDDGDPSIDKSPSYDYKLETENLDAIDVFVAYSGLQEACRELIKRLSDMSEKGNLEQVR